MKTNRRRFLGVLLAAPFVRWLARPLTGIERFIRTNTRAVPDHAPTEKAFADFLEQAR